MKSNTTTEMGRGVAPTNPKTELQRVLKSLKIVFPRRTDAATTDTNILAWALIDTLEALSAGSGRSATHSKDPTLSELVKDFCYEHWDCGDINCLQHEVNVEALSALTTHISKEVAKARLDELGWLKRHAKRTNDSSLTYAINARIKVLKEQL